MRTQADAIRKQLGSFLSVFKTEMGYKEQSAIESAYLVFFDFSMEG